MARANELAAALEILGPDHQWTALCVHCLHRTDPHEDRPAMRAADGGDCTQCPYTGRDVFVVLLKGDL